MERVSVRDQLIADDAARRARREDWAGGAEGLQRCDGREGAKLRRSEDGRAGRGGRGSAGAGETDALGAGQRKEGEGTRERLVETARRLFHENGYSATGVSAILKAANVRSGSFYYFFEAKEALLVAVLERYVELLVPMVMRPAFDQTDDPIERIFAVLFGYRRMLTESKFSLGCPLGNLALEMSTGHPEVRDLILLNFRQWCEAIEYCLEMAADRLPADLDRGRLARFVLTVMEGGIMQARAQQSIEPYDASVAGLRDYVNQLLARRASQGSGR